MCVLLGAGTYVSISAPNCVLHCLSLPATVVARPISRSPIHPHIFTMYAWSWLAAAAATCCCMEAALAEQELAAASDAWLQHPQIYWDTEHTAPKLIPEYLQTQFIGPGTKHEEFYINESAPVPGAGAASTATSMKRWVKKAASDLMRSSRHLPRYDVCDAVLAGAQSNERWLQLAWLTVAPKLKGATVAVFGSTSPRIEATALALGAQRVIVVEYNPVQYQQERVESWSIPELARRIAEGSAEQADVALSISSFDHDGLGRYGDPLSPDADLTAMVLMHAVLKPSGIALVSVPVGQDTVYWNLQRRYGMHRLPRLLAGWTALGVAGPANLSYAGPVRRNSEPVWVLQPRAQWAGAVRSVAAWRAQCTVDHAACGAAPRPAVPLLAGDDLASTPRLCQRDQVRALFSEPHPLEDEL